MFRNNIKKLFSSINTNDKLFCDLTCDKICACEEHIKKLFEDLNIKVLTLTMKQGEDKNDLK
jgi:hypothetical protein